jgi:hypothetical protein
MHHWPQAVVQANARAVVCRDVCANVAYVSVQILMAPLPFTNLTCYRQTDRQTDRQIDTPASECFDRFSNQPPEGLQAYVEVLKQVLGGLPLVPWRVANASSFFQLFQATSALVQSNLLLPRKHARFLFSPQAFVLSSAPSGVLAMAQAAGAEGGDWKTKLNLPPKDTRIRTEASRPT